MDDILDVEVVAEVEVEVENEIDIEVDVEQAGPAGKDGKSAYDIYVANGGKLTEIEWLESLKGEPGTDGYTPVKGIDYWTEEDQNEIETFVNNAVDQAFGIALEGEY